MKKENSTHSYLQKAFGCFPALIIVHLVCQLYPLAIFFGCKGIVVTVFIHTFLQELVHSLWCLAADALFFHPQPDLSITLCCPHTGARRGGGCLERKVFSILELEISCCHNSNRNTSISTWKQMLLHPLPHPFFDLFFLASLPCDPQYFRLEASRALSNLVKHLPFTSPLTCSAALRLLYW